MRISTVGFDRRYLLSTIVYEMLQQPEYRESLERILPGFEDYLEEVIEWLCQFPEWVNLSTLRDIYVNAEWEIDSFTYVIAYYMRLALFSFRAKPESLPAVKGFSGPELAKMFPPKWAAPEIELIRAAVQKTERLHYPKAAIEQNIVQLANNYGAEYSVYQIENSLRLIEGGDRVEIERVAAIVQLLAERSY